MFIKIFSSKVSKTELRELADASFVDMVKGVIDIKQKLIALGGELHADAEELLLEQGSKQVDLWGFNIYPEKSREERIEYTSLINIRPKQGNLKREIQSETLRLEIKKIIDERVE